MSRSRSSSHSRSRTRHKSRHRSNSKHKHRSRYSRSRSRSNPDERRRLRKERRSQSEDRSGYRKERRSKDRSGHRNERRSKDRLDRKERKSDDISEYTSLASATSGQVFPEKSCQEIVAGLLEVEPSLGLHGILLELDNGQGVSLEQSSLTAFAFTGLKALFSLLGLDKAPSGIFTRPSSWGASVSLSATLLKRRGALPLNLTEGIEDDEYLDIGPKLYHDPTRVPLRSSGGSSGKLESGADKDLNWMTEPGAPGGHPFAGLFGGGIAGRSGQQSKLLESSFSSLAQKPPEEAPQKSMLQKHRELLLLTAKEGGDGERSMGSRPSWDRDSAMALQTTANHHYKSTVGGFEQPGVGPVGLKNVPTLASRFV